MSGAYHVAVCGTLVPDPLQTLEPVMGPQGPALRNETLLPSVLDPWAAPAPSTVSAAVAPIWSR